MNKLCVLLFFSFVLSDDVESYDLMIKYNVNEADKHHIDTIMDMSLPGLGEMQVGYNYLTTSKWLGEKDGLIAIEYEISKMIAINKIWDEIAPDQNLKLLADIPILVYLNHDGTFSHVDEKQSHIEETFKGLVVGQTQHNFLFPFGEEAVGLSIGSKWTMKEDSIIYYAGDGDVESIMSSETEFSLDKIKTKKGKKIAYISGTSIMNCNMRFMQSGMFFEGPMTGEMKHSYRFDLNNGKIIKQTSSGEMDMHLTMEGQSWRTIINLSDKRKKVK